MKLSKKRDIGTFSHLYSGEETRTHTIRLLVENECITVNEMVLEWWSEEYKSLLEEDENCIFLLDFIGCSDDVKDCIALLHGIEVEANLENIVVLTKFGSKFKIPELLNEIVCWFEDNLTTDNLLEVFSVISKISEMNLDLTDRLVVLLQSFIRDNIHTCREIIEYYIDDLDNLVIDVCLGDPILLETFIDSMPDAISDEKDCKKVILKLEGMLENNADTLLEMREEVEYLVEFVGEMAVSPQFLKQTAKFMKTLMELPISEFPTSSTSQPTTYLTFQSWRGMTKSELKMHKTDVTEYEFAMILVDWIEKAEHRPEMDDVLELYNDLRQEQLEFWFVYKLQYTLCYTLNYSNIPQYVCQLPEYKLHSIGVKRNMEELLDCMVNNKAYRIADECGVQNCTYYKDTLNKHVITITFKTVSDRLQIETVPTEYIDDFTEHTHDDIQHYTNWYIDSLDTAKNNRIVRLCPLFTKSYTEIVTTTRSYGSFIGLFCLISTK